MSIKYTVLKVFTVYTSLTCCFYLFRIWHLKCIINSELKRTGENMSEKSLLIFVVLTLIVTFSNIVSAEKPQKVVIENRIVKSF